MGRINNRTIAKIMCLCIQGVYMRKVLYWRVKRDGKWTWSPVVIERDLEEIELAIKELLRRSQE